MSSYIKLDKGTILEIIAMYKTGAYTNEEIGEEFGIPESCVNKILRYC